LQPPFGTKDTVNTHARGEKMLLLSVLLQYGSDAYIRTRLVK